MTVYSTDTLPGGVYRPPTGISRFHLSYDDTRNTIVVTVRATAEFSVPNGKVAWTAHREAEFTRLLHEGIGEVWDKRFALINGDRRIRPTVQLQIVQDGAYMRMTVQSGVSPPEIAAFLTSRSHMSLFAAGLDVLDGNLVLRLDEGTVLPYSDLIAPVTAETLNQHASQIEAYEESEERARTALAGKSGRIAFPKGSSTVTDDIRRSIQAAISYTASTVYLGQKRVPLEVTGYRNSSETRALSLQRAQNVAAIVRASGNFDPQLVAAVDGGSKFSGHRYAVIRPLSLPQIIAKVDYRAAIHEFGHCLGLPDEYRLYPGLSVEGSHDAYDALCRDNRLSHPPYPAKHDSIMSTGSRLYRCHYVTILDCLKRVSGDDDWSIE
ncbi:hypothetical protein DXV76_16395 [Rhodobacteraceae bacterium CCMM004]|nr:hypothetical protein DXV76_16395 [Rhodobacteraceae bacterium CCMM004]